MILDGRYLFAYVGFTLSLFVNRFPYFTEACAPWGRGRNKCEVKFLVTECLYFLSHLIWLDTFPLRILEAFIHLPVLLDSYIGLKKLKIIFLFFREREKKRDKRREKREEGPGIEPATF